MDIAYRVKTLPYRVTEVHLSVTNIILLSFKYSLMLKYLPTSYLFRYSIICSDIVITTFNTNYYLQESMWLQFFGYVKRIIQYRSL